MIDRVRRSKGSVTKTAVAASKPAPSRQTAFERQLSDAFAAMSSGEWEVARSRFTALAEADPSPAGEVLEGLAVSLFRVGSVSQACAAMERAHAAFIDEASPHRAIRAAAFMVSARSVLGEQAASRGWEQRGLRLVEQTGPCIEQGYLALATVGCEIHDARELTRRAELAHMLALKFGDHELELRALGDLGLALVSRGQVDKGFGLLDEAMVGAAAGEMPTVSTRCMTYCAMFSACERTGDIGRAEYWCRHFEENMGTEAIGLVHCDVLHGVVESLRGRWDNAEARLTSARDAPAASAHYRSDSAGRLAELRIQQGRYREAEELLAGFEDRIEAMPALARLRLVQGDHQQAAALLRSVARGFGEDYMRLAPVLAVSIEVELQRGDAAAARRTADRLFKLEDLCESNEIRALARLGRARVALYDGDHGAAIEELETALTLLIHLERPMLTSQVRLELARALARAGDNAGALAEAENALAGFHRLGIAPEIGASQSLIGLLTVDAAGDATGRHADLASRAESPIGIESLTKRESEIAALVADGLSNREIADRVFLSVRTVECHVDRVLGKLAFHTRTQLAGWVHRKGAAKT